MQTLQARYRKLRKDGLSALVAHYHAKRSTTDYDYEIGEPFERDGFSILVTTEIDDYNDISGLGRFPDDSTGHSAGIVLRNHAAGWNDYKWFRPETPVRTVARDLMRLKYGKRQAYELAWSQAKDDLRQALDYVAYAITVTVSVDGIELGSDELGCCAGYDDLRECVDANGMIENAVDAAQASLAKLCTKGRC